MKVYFSILLFTLIICGCKKDKKETAVRNPYVVVHAIKYPITYVDTFSVGKLAKNLLIDSIVRRYYGVTNRYFFSYTTRNRLASVNYLPDRHPQSCAGFQLVYKYEGEKLTRFTEVSPTSGCQLNYNHYEYEYFPTGALKAITFQNDYTISEQFFEYNQSGRLSKVYFNGRYKTDTDWQYGTQEYTYDANGNVSQLLRKEQFNIHATERINFTYDSTINPFKGQLSLSKYLPALLYVNNGPLFLSNNNVRTVIREFLPNQNPQLLQGELFYKNGQYSGLSYGPNDIHTIFYR